MKHLLTVRVGGKYMVIPKLLGAMLIVIAILMFVSATADVVNIWDKAKDIRSCVLASEGSADKYAVCVLKGIQAGFYVYGRSNPLPDEDVWAVTIGKAAVWLFWVTVLIIAMVIFKSGRLVLPIEEEEIRIVEDSNKNNEVNEKAHETKKTSKRTRKTSRGRRKKTS